MSIDLAPAPGAAPARSRVLSTARIETTLLLRNGEQLLLALVIPLAALIGGRFAGHRLGMDFATLAPSVWVLAIWSTSFSSVAIATGFDRRYGVLERLAATPLGRGGLLLGKVLAALTVIAGQLAILVLVAVLLGWRPGAGVGVTIWSSALLGGILGIGCFTALALALSGTARAELTLALANLIYLVGAAAGILVPTASFGSLSWLNKLLPTGALGDLWRALGDGNGAPMSLLVLAVWALAGAVLARKVFRWVG